MASPTPGRLAAKEGLTLYEKLSLAADPQPRRHSVKILIPPADEDSNGSYDHFRSDEQSLQAWAKSVNAINRHQRSLSSVSTQASPNQLPRPSSSRPWLARLCCRTIENQPISDLAIAPPDPAPRTMKKSTFVLHRQRRVSIPGGGLQLDKLLPREFTQQAATLPSQEDTAAAAPTEFNRSTSSLSMPESGDMATTLQEYLASRLGTDMISRDLPKVAPWARRAAAEVTIQRVTRSQLRQRKSGAARTTPASNSSAASQQGSANSRDSGDNAPPEGSSAASCVRRNSENRRSGENLLVSGSPSSVSEMTRGLRLRELEMRRNSAASSTARSREDEQKRFLPEVNQPAAVPLGPLGSDRSSRPSRRPSQSISKVPPLALHTIKTPFSQSVDPPVDSKGTSERSVVRAPSTRVMRRLLTVIPPDTKFPLKFVETDASETASSVAQSRSSGVVKANYSQGLLIRDAFNDPVNVTVPEKLSNLPVPITLMIPDPTGQTSSNGPEGPPPAFGSGDWSRTRNITAKSPPESQNDQNRSLGATTNVNSSPGVQTGESVESNRCPLSQRKESQERYVTAPTFAVPISPSAPQLATGHVKRRKRGTLSDRGKLEDLKLLPPLPDMNYRRNSAEEWVREMESLSSLEIGSSSSSSPRIDIKQFIQFKEELPRLRSINSSKISSRSYESVSELKFEGARLKTLKSRRAMATSLRFNHRVACEAIALRTDRKLARLGDFQLSLNSDTAELRLCKGNQEKKFQIEDLEMVDCSPHNLETAKSADCAQTWSSIDTAQLQSTDRVVVLRYRDRHVPVMILFESSDDRSDFVELLGINTKIRQLKNVDWRLR